MNAEGLLPLGHPNSQRQSCLCPEMTTDERKVQDSINDAK